MPTDHPAPPTTEDPAGHTAQVATAFSGHRFAETFAWLAPDVRWELPGRDPILGKEAVVLACTASAAGMAGLADASFSRFVHVAGDRVAAVDAVGHYRSTDGSESVVSSADVYEFDAAGLVTTITSYTVELPGSGPDLS